MVRCERLRNKLHEHGYSFKRQADRVMLYKRPNHDYVSIPRKDLVDDQYVRATLTKIGCSPDEIEAFIGANREA